jgi:hypothetical protein
MLKKKDLEDIQKMVSKLMTDTMNSGTVTRENDPRRIRYPRFSSFPFCGVQWFFNLPGLVSRRAVKDFAFGYFTSVGTAVHLVKQEALTRYVTSIGGDSIKVYWDYVCTNTECKKRHILLAEKPTECSACGGVDFHRDEHEVKYKGALGHIDNITSFALPPRLQDSLGIGEATIVMDYKTSSIHNTTVKADTLPYASNQAQIDKYTAVMQKRTKHLPPVIGNALVYLPRDVPFRHKTFFKYMSEEEGVKHREDIVSYVADHSRWISVETIDDALESYDERPCRSGCKIKSEYADCEYLKYCTSNNGTALVKTTFSKVKKYLPILKD